MASGRHRRHFADPHMLLQTQYNRTSGHTCDICGSELAGLAGYRCNACDFDVHEACAGYFTETISFFAHPWHTLRLSRMPSSCAGWVCDLCGEDCPPGDFVYRCIRCNFDVHPLCTMLPQTVRSPLHPEHDLQMVPSSGECSACCADLPVWHYVCGGSCQLRLHIACVAGAPPPPPGGAGQGNGGVGHSATAASQSVVARQSRRSRVAKFILKQVLGMAIEAATGGAASAVLDVQTDAS
ncbi:hypothetical protein ACP70R_005392 [Stipagrostis hirtigluma subsp. patula]